AAPAIRSASAAPPKAARVACTSSAVHIVAHLPDGYGCSHGPVSAHLVPAHYRLLTAALARPVPELPAVRPSEGYN
ncbi:MAG TPA: hypothetical protein VGG54_28580, partial [Trebonia sp.]